jgi:hypothetical protein
MSKAGSESATGCTTHGSSALYKEYLSEITSSISFGNVHSYKYVRFEVFTTVTMNNGVFCDVTPCDYCKNRRFGGT